MLDQIDEVSLDREVGIRGKLVDFVKMAWPFAYPDTYIHNWHVDLICDHLEAVHTREIQWLILNVPPGCMKSSLVQVFWPVWTWIRDPSHRFGSWSFDKTNVERDAKKSLLIMQSEWFQSRWGHLFSLAKDPAIGSYQNSVGGHRFSNSIEGKALGKHFHTQIIDDPSNTQKITEASLSEAENFAGNVLETRWVDLKRAARVLVMQRIHDKDLSAFYENTGRYTSVKLPMRFEPKTAFSGPFGSDPRTEEGELLFPDRFPEDAVTEVEKGPMGAMNVAAQYQQRPVPEGGAIFRLDWFKSADPKLLLALNFDVVCQSWDCAFKGEDDSDFVVGQVWARKGSDFYLLDEWRKRANFTETQEAIRAVKRKWPRTGAILIEDKANGPAIITSLQKEIPGIVAINPQGGKIARANAVQHLFAAGNVWHVDPDFTDEGGRKPYQWVNDHRLELAAFPRGVNDDRVDACSQGLVWLLENRTQLMAAMANIDKFLASF